MADRVKEISCLCGARERDEGQERPRKCWDCGKETMGEFPFVERVRTIMQNNDPGMWRNFGTPEERRAHIEREQREYDAMAERAKGRNYL